MKLVGLTICKDEDWVIEFCLRSALTWVDEIVLVDNGSTDATEVIVNRLREDYRGRIHPIWYGRTDQWDEMVIRQASLDVGRQIGGSHFAIIDADEALTANTAARVRENFEALAPGELIETPMLAMRSLRHYQDDASVWSGAWLTIGFCDQFGLTWKPAGDGYQHHHRAPYGCQPNAKRIHKSKAQGGAFHFQFANARRLLAKHILYRMVDHLRWPGRENAKQLNWKYDQALQVPARCTEIPEAWYDGLDPSLITLDGQPWHEEEIRRLLRVHGRDAFKGLDLKGVLA